MVYKSFLILFLNSSPASNICENSYFIFKIENKVDPPSKGGCGRNVKLTVPCYAEYLCSQLVNTIWNPKTGYGILNQDMESLNRMWYPETGKGILKQDMDS